MNKEGFIVSLLTEAKENDQLKGLIAKSLVTNSSPKDQYRLIVADEDNKEYSVVGELVCGFAVVWAKRNDEIYVDVSDYDDWIVKPSGPDELIEFALQNWLDEIFKIDLDESNLDYIEWVTPRNKEGQ
jgi:hypothetical protein